MDPVSPEAFERRLAALGRDDLAAFVADLWAERGWETTVEDGVVVARRGGEVRRLAPASRSFGRWQTPAPPADAVVVPRSNASDAPETALDAEDLREALLYGVDREAGERLSLAHFGRPLADDETSAWSVPPWAPVAVALLVVVAAVGVLAVQSGPGANGGGDPTAASGGDGRPAGDAAGAVRASTPAEAATGRHPAGLDSDGVSDADALAQAHGAAVGDASYRLRITHEGTTSPRFERRWLAGNETVVVANRTTYLHTVGGVLKTDDGLVPVEAVTYADGAYAYTRRTVGNETAVERSTIELESGDENAFTDRVEGYVARYLTTNRSSVALVEFGEPRLYYQVIATGRPERVTGDVTDYTAWAVVDADGFVWYLGVSYLQTVGDEQSRVRLTVDYGDADGPPTPPDWYPAVRDATAADDVAPAGSDLPEPALEPSYARSATNETTSASSSRLMPWPVS